MTAFTDTFSKRTPGLRLWTSALFFLAASAVALPGVRAAETSATAAAALKVLSAPLNGAYDASNPSGHSSASHNPSVNLITVQKGESIDAVLRRGLPGMPLKDEFMRQALAKANPKIFPKGQTYPVRPGTVLTLPSVDALRQHILAQSPQAAALFQVSAVKEDAEESRPGPDKRRWVRFP